MRPFRFGPQRVPAPLRDYVASISAYAAPPADDPAAPPAEHRGLPSTTLTLVLPVGVPLDVAWAGDPGSRVRRWSNISGLHTGPAVIHRVPGEAGVYLDLTLAGARALLGLPAAALAGELVDLEELGAPLLAELPDRVHAAPDWSARVRVVTEVLQRGSRPDRARAGPALEEAVGRLTAGATVQQVAAEVGYGRRHLGELVRRETGVSPKQLHRISRFARSRASLVSQSLVCQSPVCQSPVGQSPVGQSPVGRGRASLARTAAETGYADQSHLSREWVSLAGCPPSVWLREELPFVQGEPAAAG